MIQWPIYPNFWLLTPEEYQYLPIGTNIKHINGITAKIGSDDELIKQHFNTYPYRDNHLGWGINDVYTHHLNELFFTFIIASSS